MVRIDRHPSAHWDLGIMDTSTDFRAAENDQTKTGVERISRWSLHGEGDLDDDDVVISASVDEVISREVLHQLRWCELKSDVTFGALWMPMGNLGKAKVVDNPSALGPHLHMQPSIYKWRSLLSGQYEGQRISCIKEQCKDSLKGGIHLTNGAYLPTSILKDFTATEEAYYSGAVNWDFVFTAGLEQWNTEQQYLYNLTYRANFHNSLDNIENAHDVDPEVPYFLQCNKNRYPYWFGKTDPRNEDFMKILQDFRQKHGLHPKVKCPLLFNLAYVGLNKTNFAAIVTCPD